MFLLFTVLSSPSNLNMPHGVKVSFLSLKFCDSRFSQNPKNRKIETKTQNHNPTVQAIQNQRSQITIRVTQPNWPTQLSTPYKTPTTPTHLPSHYTLFSKKLNQFPLKTFFRFPKSFSLTFSNGRKRQISRRRHREEEHISEQQGRSPVPRRPYRPFPQNRQVRRTRRRWRPCLPRRRPRVSRRRGQSTVFDSYKFCYICFF